MAHHFNHWTTIVRDDEDIEINVEYTATPIVPAVLYGDCPQPAEGGEIEITAVFADGVALDPPLSDAEESKILDYLGGQLSDTDFDDGDYDDWCDE